VIAVENLIINIIVMIVMGVFTAFLVFANYIKEKYYLEQRNINERNKKK